MSCKYSKLVIVENSVHMLETRALLLGSENVQISFRL